MLGRGRRGPAGLIEACLPEPRLRVLPGSATLMVLLSGQNRSLLLWLSFSHESKDVTLHTASSEVVTEFAFCL